MSDDLRLPDLKMTFKEKAATSMSLMVYARVAMLSFGIVGTVGTPVAGLLVSRLISAIDTMNERQRLIGLDFIELRGEVRNVVSDQLRSVKNTTDRIEQGERIMNDRINAQATWAQQLSQKLDELSKYVYTKVR